MCSMCTFFQGDLTPEPVCILSREHITVGWLLHHLALLEILVALTVTNSYVSSLWG